MTEKEKSELDTLRFHNHVLAKYETEVDREIKLLKKQIKELEEKLDDANHTIHMSQFFYPD